MKTATMKLRPFLRTVALACALCLGTQAQFASAQTNITVEVDHPGAAIPPGLFGIFFEDINFAADGGLYPERVKNRSFEFPDPLMGWQRAVPGGGSFEVRTDHPVSARNTHYLRLSVADPAHPFGLMNDGFRGVGVEAGKSYVFS